MYSKGKQRVARQFERRFLQPPRKEEAYQHLSLKERNEKEASSEKTYRTEGKA